ncbi:MAG: glycosyltransferase [Pseudomonadota bacterium]
MSAKPIRVAQVMAGGAHGGAENFFTRLTCALNEQSLLTEKAFTRPHQHRTAELAESSVDTATFRFGGPLDLLDAWRYRKALHAWQPDIVLTWMSRASQLTPKGNYILVNRLGSYYNLKNYRKADYWIGISKGICQYMIDGGIPADRVFHIPNFADESPVEAIDRTSFNTPADKPLLLTAGRLHSVKGFDTLLQALVHVPEAHLWLAGSGPEDASLKQLCSDLKLDDRVHFLGWRNDVSALMRTADMFICSSRHEGLGSIVLESWLNHCPIVATRAQGPAEIIEDGVTGLLTPVDDAMALASAINRTISDPDLRTDMRMKAHEHYMRHYSKASIVQRYCDFFEQISGKS